MRVHHLITVGVLFGALCAANLSSAALTGRWQFDEGTGDTAFNDVIGGFDGEIANHLTGGLGADGSVWVDDPLRGSVISFEGSANSAYVFAGTLPIVTLEQDFTWALWVNNMTNNATTDDQNAIVMGNRYTLENTEYVPRQFNKLTRRAVEIHMNGNGNDNILFYEDPMPENEWHHHAIVKDGTTLKYYRDGVEYTNLTKQFTQGQSEPMSLFFGGDNTLRAQENFLGLIDDARVYDSALTDEEVAELLLPDFVGLPGDVNLDTVVDTADLTLIRNKYFESVTGSPEDRYTQGDLNNDRIVDFLDYRIWKENYIPGAGELASIAIPEPACLALALLGGVALCGVRRRD